VDDVFVVDDFYQSGRVGQERLARCLRVHLGLVLCEDIRFAPLRRAGEEARLPEQSSSGTDPSAS
jgi:hypothetical protein